MTQPAQGLDRFRNDYVIHRAAPADVWVVANGMLSNGLPLSVYVAPKGDPCAADHQCATGHCADGRCCDAACDQPCDVCAATLGASANGTCTPAPAWPRTGPSPRACSIRQSHSTSRPSASNVSKKVHQNATPALKPSPMISNIRGRYCGTNCTTRQPSYRDADGNPRRTTPGASRHRPSPRK